MASNITKLRSSLGDFRNALQSFAKSPSTFRVVKATNLDTANDHDMADTAPDLLYVLDSSFNPPTRGHMDIALSALKSDASPAKHLLLLLATQNADKPSKPALLEHRIAMMDLFAEEIINAFSEDPKSSTSDDTGTTPHSEITVHLGITKHPYFIDKSNAISGGSKSSASSSDAPSADDSSDTPFPFPPTRQAHLIGFDTFTRVFNPKYYEPDHTLKPLAPLFTNHSVRVTSRPDDGFGSLQDQEQYIEDIASGKRNDEGAEQDWVKKISLTKGVNSSGSLTSSTRAREAAKAGDQDILMKMCGEKVAQWILHEKLYKDT